MYTCPECRQLAAEVAALKAETITTQEEIRVLIEDRMAQGLDVTPVLDSLKEAGIEVGGLLTP